MKKITLIFAAVFAVGSLMAQQTYKWNGGQTDQIWDYAVANWIDPTFPLPLPKTFSEGSSAIFDDTSVEGSDTLKINGVISVNNVSVNAAKTYVIRSTSTTLDSIVGTGVFTKDGIGLLVMDVKNKMIGGTLLKAGKMMMEKQSSANIFGDKIVFGGGVANFATTTSSSYPSIKVPLEIPAGVTAKVELSRYSYFASPISGDGDLIMAAGGERCMMGTNKAGGVYVDWSNFKGNVTLEPYKMTGVTPGYYGLLLPVTKTFRYETLAYPDSIFFTADTMFAKRKLTLKAGVGLTAASGTRCYAIGELNAEDESAFIGGYGAGKSSTPRVYYMVGGSNSNVICPVSFKDVGGSDYNYVGVIKVGTGKYTFTSTKSLTAASMGVQVNQGSFFVNVPITDGVTALGRVRSVGNALTINKNAIGGGNGRLTGKVQVDSLGTLIVGYEGIGMLALNDTLGGNTTASPLLVKKGGKIEFELASTNSYDKIITNSTATLNDGTLVLKPALGVAINDGDKFTLISARTEVLADTFKIDATAFPSGITFTAEKDTVGVGYRIIVTAHGATGVKPVKESVVSVVANSLTKIVKIESAKAINSVEIVNVQGQIVYSKTVKSTEAQINLQSLKTGIYYARVSIGDGVEVKKIMLK